jgi:hypothetical protein
MTRIETRRYHPSDGALPHSPPWSDGAARARTVVTVDGRAVVRCYSAHARQTVAGARAYEYETRVHRDSRPWSSLHSAVRQAMSWVVEVQS